MAQPKTYEEILARVRRDVYNGTDPRWSDVRAVLYEFDETAKRLQELTAVFYDRAEEAGLQAELARRDAEIAELQQAIISLRLALDWRVDGAERYTSIME